MQMLRPNLNSLVVVVHRFLSHDGLVHCEGWMNHLNVNEALSNPFGVLEAYFDLPADCGWVEQCCCWSCLLTNWTMRLWTIAIFGQLVVACRLPLRIHGTSWCLCTWFQVFCIRPISPYTSHKHLDHVSVIVYDPISFWLVPLQTRNFLGTQSMGGLSAWVALSAHPSACNKS